MSLAPDSSGARPWHQQVCNAGSPGAVGINEVRFTPFLQATTAASTALRNPTCCQLSRSSARLSPPPAGAAAAPTPPAGPRSSNLLMLLLPGALQLLPLLAALPAGGGVAVPGAPQATAAPPRAAAGAAAQSPPPLLLSSSSPPLLLMPLSARFPLAALAAAPAESALPSASQELRMHSSSPMQTLAVIISSASSCSKQTGQRS